MFRFNASAFTAMDLLPNKVYEAKRQDFDLQRSGQRRAHSDGGV